MARRMTVLEVRRTERLTPRMIRVVAGGADLDRFPDTQYTDRNVKIVFPRPGVAYPEPFDMDVIRARLPRDQWPFLRTYTVRALDREIGELGIDVVLHGDQGIAGPWAATARAGEILRLLGPEGSYAPDPAADWHLMVGDESALPAIAAACERVPAGVPVVAVLEVADAAEEQPVATAADLHVTWLHRAGTAPGLLVDAVRDLEFPDGRVHAFVHGEAGAVRDVRRHLVGERGVPREHLSVSGYWRRGRSEDGGPEEGRVAREPGRTRAARR